MIAAKAILYVEPDEMLSKVMSEKISEWFGRERIELTCVRDFTSALRALAKVTFNLVISSNQINSNQKTRLSGFMPILPKREGSSHFMEKYPGLVLKQFVGQIDPDVPYIMLSGDDSAVPFARQYGVAYFFRKPLNTNSEQAFFELVETLLRDPLVLPYVVQGEICVTELGWVFRAFDGRIRDLRGVSCFWVKVNNKDWKIVETRELDISYPFKNFVYGEGVRAALAEDVPDLNAVEI